MSLGRPARVRAANSSRIFFMRNNMEKLSMNYFNGVRFVCSGCVADYTSCFTRRFEDYYGIQYSQDGEFVVSMNGAYQRTVSGPWVLITRPGPLFRYGAPPGRRRFHAFVCFKGPRVDSYIKSGLLPINPREPLIRITRPERFLETLRRMIFLLNPLTDVQYCRAVHTLENLLLQLHEQPPETETFPEYRRAEFMKLTARVNETPERPWDFRDTARKMNVSYPHFRRLFRLHCGMAPGQFLIQARLRQAAASLIATDLQLKTIAEQCGLVDSFYFSRLFKKYYRLPPRRYRKEFRSY